MNSLTKSLLFALVKTLAFIFMALPITVDLWVARLSARFAYIFMARKRKVVYANLKTVFASTHDPAQLRALTRIVFMNFAQGAVELLCIPKMQRLGFNKFVDTDGKENLEQALGLGKGVVLLAIHAGSWELGSVIAGMTKSSYYEMVNTQPKIPQLDIMLNEYRTMAGARLITAGKDTKDLIKAMRSNEVVSIVLDQGGRDGLEVPFLGKTASMSTGAIRLALKYGCAICPVRIQRVGNAKHVLKIFPAMPLVETGDFDKDVLANVRKSALVFDEMVRNHPADYMWFYKVFKYSSHKRILILDDGRTGHLRQSQAMAGHLKEVLKKREKIVEDSSVTLCWKGEWAKRLFSYYAFFAPYVSILRREDCLKFFLTEQSYKELMSYKADYIVSCGSQASGVNFILSQNHLARSITILSPGYMPQRCFDAVVLPEHDRIQRVERTSIITPRVSPNLINPAYLKDQSEGLMKHYSHLKGNVRTKFGILIGGDTKGVKFSEQYVRQLLGEIKQAALHYKADILITTSRRTPPAIEQIILKELKNFERCSLCIIANQRNVPEAVGGILGLSDLVIVSGESISMVSEALSSGKKTIVFSPRGRYEARGRDKYEKFVLKLNDDGYLMVSSTDDMKAKIAQLLSQKITLKTLDDQNIIRKGLEALV